MMLRTFAVALCFLPVVVFAQEGVFTTRPGAKQELVPLPKEEGAFHFVIFGDRTGGPDEGIEVLKQAVRDTNLLDPDLVMTVGDLVQGYNTTPQWMMQMREYRGVMSKLRMPWFPVAGNHDIYWRGPGKPPGEHERDYELHFGPLWYAFRHKNAGFVAIYSDEGDPETGEKGLEEARLQNVSPAQYEFLRQAMEKLGDCDHVFLFLHHPRWLGGPYADSNWNKVHELLVEAGNVTAVFGGHIHRVTYAGAKDGIEYFTLATVGGELHDERLPQAGFLHHINVVTVRKEGIQVATIPVGQVIDPREFTVERNAEILRLVRTRLESQSKPIRLMPGEIAKGTVTLSLENPTTRPIEVTLVADAGPAWSVLPDHRHFVVEAGKTQVAAFRARFRGDAAEGDFSPAGFVARTEYLGETARVALPERRVAIPVELAVPDDLSPPTEDRVLSLGGRGAARVESEAFELPDGPFTLEAWVNPSRLEDSQAIVAKTQTSEYALFLHDGRPDFDVYLGDRYVSATAEDPLAANRWTHIAGVFTGEEVVLYLDGKPVAQTAGTGTRVRNDLPLYLGADPGEQGEWTRPFSGRIDEVRLSKTARYREAFQPRRRLESDEETVLLYDFGQTAGPFVLDRSKPFAEARLEGEGHLAPAENDSEMPANERS